MHELSNRSICSIYDGGKVSGVVYQFDLALQASMLRSDFMNIVYIPTIYLRLNVDGHELLPESDQKLAADLVNTTVLCASQICLLTRSTTLLLQVMPRLPPFLPFNCFTCLCDALFLEVVSISSSHSYSWMSLSGPLQLFRQRPL
jgi:hypothetical protein